MKSNATIVALLCGILALMPAFAQRAFDVDILVETFGYDQSTTRSVDLDDLHQGCSRRDCIPSIDRPKFIPADEADYLDDDDLVLALSVNGYRRAYPTRILDQHEIVNDIIAGIPIAVTWCPLCGSGVAVHREIDGMMTEFGVSGLLYNSDLVFYDRRTETLWEQIEAKGIVGPLTGHELKLTPLTVTRWGRWRATHRDSLVLSTDTGFRFDYTRDAYARYRRSGQLMFPVSRNDDSVPPKTVVFGFDADGRKLAVTGARLEEEPAIAHRLDGAEVTIEIQEDGSVWLTDANSGERHAATRLFWFAWYTFHPDTELLK